MSHAGFLHHMPFGAELLESGGTRFRLWAPSSPRVELLLPAAAADRRLRLEPRADGWHELEVAEAGAGTRYAFEVSAGAQGALRVPDPASRWNPDGVHAASVVLDPRAHRWRNPDWAGRPWREAVLYEIHVGTFTGPGTFAALEQRLPELAALGITALQIMPLAAFAGTRNWGYDGVLPFAPAGCYGRPDELKSLIDGAHALGLMVLLDVVYNHFGPDGNYLHAYCPEFFNGAHHTPWGAAINLDGPRSRTVRDFFVHNALYWMEEYRFDGLRLDAVHAFRDASTPDLVEEIAQVLRQGPGREREVHLVLENHNNEGRRLQRDRGARPRQATAQWDDDVHHAMHVLLTGEHDGYYVDFAERALEQLARALAQGFAFQGEYSRYRGRARGEPSADLPPTAFVGFLQNHDMIGNRARGERIDRLAPAALLEAAYVCLLLAPQVPLLFMGEEFAAATPFLYFCDFPPELGRAVARGRRHELGRFAAFASATGAAPAAAIPEPNEAATFFASKLDWTEPARPPHRERRALIAELLAVRQRSLVPQLDEIGRGSPIGTEPGVLGIEWRVGARAVWRLTANLSSTLRRLETAPVGELIFALRRDPSEPRRLVPGAAWVTQEPRSLSEYSA